MPKSEFDLQPTTYFTKQKPVVTPQMDYSKGGGGTWKVRPSLGLNAPLTTAELQESLKTLPKGSAFSGDIWRQARQYEEMQEGKKTALDDLGSVYQQGISSYSESSNAAMQEAVSNIEKRYTDQEQMLIQNAQRQGVGLTQLQNPNSPLSKLRAQKTAEINAEKSKTVRDIANMTNMLNLEYGKTKYAQTTGNAAEDFALRNQRMQTGIAADEAQRTEERAQARQDEVLNRVSEMSARSGAGQPQVIGEEQRTGAMFTDEQGQPLLDERQTADLNTKWEKGQAQIAADVERIAKGNGYSETQKKNLTLKRTWDLAKQMKEQYNLPQDVKEIAAQMQETGFKQERARTVTNSLSKLAQGGALSEDERNKLIDTVGPEAILKAEQAGSDEERAQAIFEIQKQQGLLNIDIAQSTLSTMDIEFGWKAEAVQKAKAQELNETNAMSVMAEKYSDLYTDGTDALNKTKGISDALVIIKGMGLGQATAYFENLKEGKIVDSTRKKQEALALAQKTKNEEAVSSMKTQMVNAGLGTEEDIAKLPDQVISDIYAQTIGKEMLTGKEKRLEAEMKKAVKDTQELGRMEAEISGWQQKIDSVDDKIKLAQINGGDLKALGTEFTSYTDKLNDAIDAKIKYINDLSIPATSSSVKKQTAPAPPMPIPLTEPKTLEQTQAMYKQMYPKENKESIWDMASNAWEAWKKSEAEAVAEREAGKSKKALKEFYKQGK